MFRQLIFALILVFAPHLMAQKAVPPLAAPPDAQPKAVPLTPSQQAKLAFDNGWNAVREGQLDEAISIFSEGIEAVPDQPGLWVARSNARFQRSRQGFEGAARDARERSLQPGQIDLWPFQKDLLDSAEDARRAFELASLKSAIENDDFPSAPYPTMKAAALASQLNSLKVIVAFFDRGRANEAMTVFQAYMTVEPDESRRTIATVALANIMFEVERPDVALSLHEQLLATQPKNPDALLGVSVSIIAIGMRADDAARTKVGLEALKRYVALAPEEHPYRDSAIEVLEFLDSMKRQEDAEGGSTGSSKADMTGKHPLNSEVVNSKAISLPKPTFPPVARFGRASGKVTVAIMIDSNGDVAKIVAVSGNPLLQAAAADAARRAKFSPTTKGGVPLQVTGTISYNFNR